MKQRVLVVDDSPFIRRIISDWVKGESDLELVGVACDGQEALAKAKETKPDIITLDVEMPVKDGLWALQEIMRECPAHVLMVSSITTQGADSTMKALQLGAYDFVTKPNGSSSLKVIQAKAEVLGKIRAAKQAKLGKTAVPIAKSAPVQKFSTSKIVVVASSTGGPRALTTFFETLPKGFPAPILIVQHMPKEFTHSFAKRLESIGTVPCKEAEHHDRILPGLAYVAPGGQHMKIESKGVIALFDGPNLHGTKPAADHLFQSAVSIYGREVVGVVLTGMGRDGADGAKAIIDAGGCVFGQEESSCVIYGMPKAAKQAGGITAEYAIEELGAHLVEALKGSVRLAS